MSRVLEAAIEPLDGVGADLHEAPLSDGVHGVAHEVEDHLFEPVGVAQHSGGLGIGEHLDGDRGWQARSAHHTRGMVGDVLQVDGRGGRLARSGDDEPSSPNSIPPPTLKLGTADASYPVTVRMPPDAVDSRARISLTRRNPPVATT